MAPTLPSGSPPFQAMVVLGLFRSRVADVLLHAVLAVGEWYGCPT
jgi:hypothetical protein